ncbi:RNase adapter RapZ [Lactobacillus sp. 3B(2020)]|uniref:RNase adapter RapZ n=1 Tax=Lactobacillus sp. 3B(2020) TaxID=2695882 RepID=UPI0015DDB241|nr:RNase adapter RapZ [Lactobacillus sp. 3B(2020)]QLL70548.1 RNase adapter RapZ [Lactobacillus sp. 3B(2020)]
MEKKFEVVVITGMSGAGKTVAVHAFEDQGYFVIDNILPSLALQFINVIKRSGEFSKMAMVMDARSKSFYEEMAPCLNTLRSQADLNVKLLFLDADDVKLVSRYKETRRSHPLAEHDGVLAGIQRERHLMASLNSEADVKIDTTTLTPRNLSLRIADYFGDGSGQTPFYVQVESFGFKYGLPLDADIVMDVRFLPNPFYLPELKHLTGNDQPVQEYVMASPMAKDFYSHLRSLLNVALPGYVKEGKSSLTIAIGCTGGQHRSVTIANQLAEDLKAAGYHTYIDHRDVDKAK